MCSSLSRVKRRDSLKKKITALVLIPVLLLSLLWLPVRAFSDVCFVSINDTLPESISPAYVRGGVAYVPCSALSSFRIYYLYDSNINTVLVYTSSQQVTIDMNQGIATDKDGVEYAATAYYRNGQVYIPAQFICSMFGLNASYIDGVGYGDICRITDGSEVLSDSLFLSAATNQMRSRYNSYQGTVAATTTPSQSTDSDDSTAADPVTEKKATVSFAFLGLPTGYLLNLLQNSGIHAAFFLTAADIDSDPETVRRLVGEGHSVGIYCPDGTLNGFETASDLLFEAAHIRTILVTAGLAESNAFRQSCQQSGRIDFRYDVNGMNRNRGINHESAVLGTIQQARGNLVVMLTLTKTNDSAVRALVYSLKSNAYHFGLLRETGYTGGIHRV